MSSRLPSRIACYVAALTLAAPGVVQAAGDLNLIPRWSVMPLYLGVLLLLIYPVNRWLLRPLNTLALERELRTVGARERADSVRATAGEVSSRLEASMREAGAQAQARQAAIKDQAQREERRVLAAAREAGAAQIEEVRRGIAAELESARARLRGDAQALARDAASKILGRAL
jgi:F0F1-type ATP synthase membrane subunit b/b'